MLAAAALLLLVASLSPALQHQQRRQRTHRRLGEDAALSAALNGLPVAPSARGPTVSGVNVYGLDPNLLAALQGSGATAAAPPFAPAPAPRLAISGSTGQAASAPEARAAPPRSVQYAPLDPYLAAALENQGHAPSPAAAMVLPSAAPSAGAAPPSGSAAPAVAVAAGTPWAAQQACPCLSTPPTPYPDALGHRLLCS
jgi:hypothetical protein